MKYPSLFILPLMLSTAGLSSTFEFHRPADYPKLPIGIKPTLKQLTPSEFEAHATYSNRWGKKDLLCDFIVEFSVKYGTEQMTFSNYLDKFVLRAGHSIDVPMAVELEGLNGRPFEILPDTKTGGVCVEYDPQVKIGDYPKLHDLCDPEFENCDWTCPADPLDKYSCAPESPKDSF